MKVADLRKILEKYPDNMELITSATDGLVDWYVSISSPQEVEVCEMIKHPNDTFVGGFIEKGMAQASASRRPQNGCDCGPLKMALSL